MYHTVIIDDDNLARKGLKLILEKNFKEIEILGEANSVASGLSLINEVEPNLVFLDIEMPDGTGFNLLEQLTDVNFRVVFTTSYSEYAIAAFKYSAFDYIVKPVLIENVRSIIDRINDIPVLMEKKRVEVLKNNLSLGNEEDQTIALPDINGFTIVKVRVSRTLLDFDNLLVQHGFFRIHRSHLISLKNVNRYLKTDGGLVEMIDKTQLPVSPKFKEELLNRLLYNRV